MRFNLLGNTKYTGKVTDKENSKGIKNVLVTDGRNVVKTDSDGNFKLKGYYNSKFIYITTPSGYSCDSFYKPIKKATKEYNFSLSKLNTKYQNGHSFIHISDSEIGKKENCDWIERLKNDIKIKNPAFLIHTGDICYEYGLKNHINLMNSKNMGCDVRYVIGNHDFVNGKYGEQLYESIYGPTWYSFEVGNIHYIATPIRFCVDKLSGYMPNDSLIWLKNDLENIDKSKKIIMFNHTKSENEDYVFLKGKNKIDLKNHNLIGWFFGHYHYNIVYKKHGVLNVSAPRPNGGGIDSSASGYRLVSIDKNNNISTKMKYYDLDKNGEPVEQLWNIKLNGNVLFCNSALDNNTLYTATAHDDYPRDCGIYAIDCNTKKIKWYTRTDNSIKNDIVVIKDKLIAMDCEGKVYCLNKSNGEIIWVKGLEFDKKSLGTSNAIAIKNSTIIAGNSTNIYALELNNGDTKWEVKYKNGESSPAQFVIYENKVYISTHWDSLSCINIENGNVLWKTVDAKIRFRSSAPTILSKTELIAAGSDTIMIINANDGKISKSICLNGYDFASSGKILIDKSTAYIPSMNKGLVAVDLETQKELWSFAPSENILFTAPYANKGKKTIEAITISNDKIIFGANDGYLYILDLSGTLYKKYFVGSAILNKPIIDNDKIYVTTFDGYLCCYSLQ